jgi:hypothetical protein
MYKNHGHAKIGKGNVDILDQAYHKRERSQVPGPGSYMAFSDFNNSYQ